MGKSWVYFSCLINYFAPSVLPNNLSLVLKVDLLEPILSAYNNLVDVFWSGWHLFGGSLLPTFHSHPI